MIKRTAKGYRIVKSASLDDSKLIVSRNVYGLLESGERRVGIHFGGGYAYIDSSGLHSVSVRIISGVKNVLLDEAFYTTVPAGLDELIYFDPFLITIARVEEDKLITVYKNRVPIFNMNSVEKGFIGKKRYAFKEVNLGLVGAEAVFTVKASSGSDLAFLTINFSDQGVKIEHLKGEPLVLGWSGDWLATLIKEEGGRSSLLIKTLGKQVEVDFKKETFGRDFKNFTVFYVNDKEEFIGLYSPFELRFIDYGGGKVVWSKTFSSKLCVSNYPLNSDSIAVASGNKIFVIDPRAGSIKGEYQALDNVNSVIADGEYVVSASGEKLFILEERNGGLNLVGKYVVYGDVIGLNMFNNNLLVAYLGLSKVIKLIHVSLNEFTEIAFSDVVVVKNSSSQIPLFVTTGKADVKPIETSIKGFNVLYSKGFFYIVDQGNEPGEYTVPILVTIPEALPTIVDLKVKVEDVKSALRKIRVLQPEYSYRGLTIPIVIETIIDLDELHVTLSSRNMDVYGSSIPVKDIKVGEHVIPIHVLWCKAGVNDITISVVGWSKRNVINEELTAKIRFDFDIAPIYTRFFREAMYLWSPIDVNNVSILIKKDKVNYTIRGPLNRGWNELEGVEVIPDELVVKLPSGTEVIVKRGESWLKFPKL